MDKKMSRALNESSKSPPSPTSMCEYGSMKL